MQRKFDCIRKVFRATIASGGMDMKQITKDIFTSLFMGLVLPWLLLNFGVALLNNREAPVSEPVSTGPEQLPLVA